MLARLLGSQVRAAILKAFFSEERREVHLRELSRMTGFSAPCLMREAKLLVGEGILVEEKKGNRACLRANEGCALYGALKELVAKATGGEAVLARQFADSPSDVVFIYGSRAKGTVRTDSDYDLFVIGSEGLRNVIARIAAVRDEIGVEINPYVITRDEFVKRKRSGDHFINEVIADKKIFLKGGDDELATMEG